MGRTLGLIRCGKQSKITGQRKVKTWKNCPHISDLIHLQSMQLGLSVSLSLSLPVLSLHFSASSLLETLYLYHYFLSLCQILSSKQTRAKVVLRTRFNLWLGNWDPASSCHSLGHSTTTGDQKDCLIPIVYFFLSCYRWIYLHGFISGLSILFHWSVCLFFWPVSYCFHYYSFVV